MERYQNSKIYKIVCQETNEVYYGSTCQTLTQRLYQHIADSKTNSNITSKRIIMRNNYKMELVENFPCETKAELNKREGFYQSNNPCVNKNVAGQTYKEWLQTDKGTESDKKRRGKYKLTEKSHIVQEKYETKRRLTMECLLCFRQFQKREWYKHITGEIHRKLEIKRNIQLCKCGHQLDDENHDK